MSIEELGIVSDASPAVAAETPGTPEAPAQETAGAPPTVESKPQDNAEQETKKALRGVQKRIDELTRARYEAESRGKQEAEHWKQQAMAAAQQLQQLQRNAPAPRLDQYQDLEQYTSAMARHEAERLVTERLDAERQQYAEAQYRQSLQQQQAEAQRNFEHTISQKVAEAEKKFPDFLDVVTSDELPGLRGTPAFQALLESDLGAEVLYYLGKNPAKAHQIVGLSPLSQIREIGRLEAAISSGKQVTGATPPPATVGGSKGGASKDPADMSYDEFVAYRRKQIAQRR